MTQSTCLLNNYDSVNTIEAIDIVPNRSSQFFNVNFYNTKANLNIPKILNSIRY